VLRAAGLPDLSNAGTFQPLSPVPIIFTIDRNPVGHRALDARKHAA
jgi:hypothetical protein